MAEVFAPFPIQRTMCNLTFYMIEGRNFVRKKSSLTRRKVLYSSQFKNTRHFAGLMGKASKIGSQVYNALPDYWRQGWMYRSFTGEAYKMLKAGKNEEEIQQVLWQRYVQEVVSRQPEENVIVPVLEPPKRTYRKRNPEYWENKTKKSARRKALKQQIKYYAGLMAQASKIGSKLYGQLPVKYGREHYQYLTGLALRLLKMEIGEEDILAALLPTLPSAASPGPCKGEAAERRAQNVVRHQNGKYYFIPSPCKRFSLPEPALPGARFHFAGTRLFFVSSG